MEIQLGVGIGHIRFGMSKTEIEMLFGKPDRVKTDEDDDDKTIFEYNGLKTRMSFYPDEQNKLGYIECSNENLLFNGMKIINEKIEVVKNDIFGNVISDWEIEDYRSFIVYFNEKNWFSLQVEFGIVVQIELGVPFKDDETYKWPIKTSA